MHVNVAWRIESGGEGVLQIGEGKVALINTEFKGKCHTCRKYGHKQNKCLEKNKSEEEKGNMIFLSKCIHCGNVGHKATNCWEHGANKDKRLKNWKKKDDKEVGASNIEILLGCTKAGAIEYENGKGSV